MKKIRVNLGNRSYDIVIGSGISGHLGRYLKKLRIGDHAFVITNKAVKKACMKKLSSSLEKQGFTLSCFLIPDTEKSKSLAVAQRIINRISGFAQDKQVFVVALGGGVVGDVSGFVASVYKRGIPFVQVPTTLLSQVDSSIGGKTGVDLLQGKNLVGTFYQPRLVFCDTSFLRTLSARQVRAGLAEVIKYAAIKDPSMFVYLEKQRRRVLSLNDDAVSRIVYRCARIKAEIVEKDEKEQKGLRTVLNFGHTLGHAIESAAGYSSYNHGEAVSIGMLAACDIGIALGISSAGLCKRLEALLSSYGLPVCFRGIPAEKVFKAHLADKKFGKKNRFVLLSGIGKTRIVSAIAKDVISSSIAGRRKA